MGSETLREDELASLLGYPGAESSVANDSKSTRPSRRNQRDEECVDIWQYVGRGESVDELPFSADVRFTLQSVCAEFADRAQSQLSELLKTRVSVRNDKIMAETYAVFVLAMPQPTCFTVASAPPTDGKILVELPCELAFPLIESLAGGQPSGEALAPRPLTAMELRILGHVLNTLFSAWRSAWQTIIAWRPLMERIESNPRIVRCLPAAEPLIVVSCTVDLGGVTAPFRFAISARAAVTVCEERHLAASRAGHLPEQSHVPTVDAVLSTEISEPAADALRSGEEIELKLAAAPRADIVVNGRSQYRGTYTIYQGRRAIHIDEVLDALAGDCGDQSP